MTGNLSDLSPLPHLEHELRVTNVHSHAATSTITGTDVAQISRQWTFPFAHWAVFDLRQVKTQPKTVKCCNIFWQCTSETRHGRWWRVSADDSSAPGPMALFRFPFEADVWQAGATAALQGCAMWKEKSFVLANSFKMPSRLLLSWRHFHLRKMGQSQYKQLWIKVSVNYTNV